MPRPLTGVRADQPRSYRNLEKVAAMVRHKLNFQPDEAIDALRLFESLDDIQIEPTSGKPIPLGYGVVELRDSEGYVKYDRDKHIIEVLGSEEHTRWPSKGTSRKRSILPVAHDMPAVTTCCMPISCCAWRRCRPRIRLRSTASRQSTNPTKTPSGRPTRSRARC